MINFDRGAARFNYRIVGVAVQSGYVLIHRGVHDDFWTLPGGRAELGESSLETIKREMREELEVDIQVERLLWVVENFFHYDSKDYHELSLFFLIHLPPQFPRPEEVGTQTMPGREGDVPLIFRWHPLDDLDSVPLYPRFLGAGLRAMPQETKHIVHQDP